MSKQVITRENLESIFGEEIIEKHVQFMEHCHEVFSKLPKHVAFDDVVKKIAENRNYHLISGLIFVHESRLPSLKDKLIEK